MARQSPISEVDRQIGQRLRKFRIEQMGLTAVEFSRRIGIDSNRLATYEHGRSPLRYEVADVAAKTFNISQRWLAEESEPVRYYVSIEKPLRDKIPPRALFSNVYREFLKPYVEEHFALWARRWGGKLYDEGLEVLQELGKNTVGGVSSLDLLNFLHRNFVRAVDDIPSDLFQQFYRDMLLASREFQKRNINRIAEWRTAQKINVPPTWVSQTNKSDLTKVSESVNDLSVKPKFQGLLDRLKKATAQRGKKSALAKFLGVSLVQVSQWLSGDREPGGETTLQLLHWVEQQERQK